MVYLDVFLTSERVISAGNYTGKSSFFQLFPLIYYTKVKSGWRTNSNLDTPAEWRVEMLFIQLEGRNFQSSLKCEEFRGRTRSYPAGMQSWEMPDHDGGSSNTTTGGDMRKGSVWQKEEQCQIGNVYQCKVWFSLLSFCWIAFGAMTFDPDKHFLIPQGTFLFKHRNARASRACFKRRTSALWLIMWIFLSLLWPFTRLHSCWL